MKKERAGARSQRIGYYDHYIAKYEGGQPAIRACRRDGFTNGF
jgi:hypothetical protein